MKTESKNESIDIEKIIGKKLLTEVNSPSKKEKTAVNSGEYASRMRKKIQSTKKLNWIEGKHKDKNTINNDGLIISDEYKYRYNDLEYKMSMQL